MNRQRHEVADVIRTFGERYEQQHGLDGESHRILRDLTRCRTSALGGHKRVCDRCCHEEISYNSCRNRHCPKCQAQARARWLEKRADDLLDVPYFHVVFTLPDAFGPLALQNRRRVYGILFRAPRRPYRPSVATPNIWELRLASSPSCTPGARSCSYIHTSIAWSRGEGSVPIEAAGSRAVVSDSSCRYAS